MVTDADLFLETLYDTGQTFGEAAQLTRDDGNYYWRVIAKALLILLQSKVYSLQARSTSTR